MSKQSERRANGIDLLRTLGGGSYDPERAATAMIRRHGALGTFAVDHVLGNLWSRPQLSRRDRSLIVVTFLSTIGSIEELRSHVGGALHHGVTRSEIEEIVLQVAGYAGYPMAMQASRIVDEVKPMPVLLTAGRWVRVLDIQRVLAWLEASRGPDVQVPCIFDARRSVRRLR